MPPRQPDNQPDRNPERVLLDEATKVKDELGRALDRLEAANVVEQAALDIWEETRTHADFLAYAAAVEACKPLAQEVRDAMARAQEYVK